MRLANKRKGKFLSSNAQDFIEESDVIVHPLTALNS